jgi:copper homeostasis protein CutC
MGPYPRAIRPRSGDWRYDWQFAEIFEDEVDGAFEEIDPWL